MEEFRAELRAMRHCVEEVKSQVVNLSEVATKLDYSIRGNGKPGINQKIAVLEQKVETNSKVVWWLIGVLSTVAAGAVALALKY